MKRLRLALVRWLLGSAPYTGDMRLCRILLLVHIPESAVSVEDALPYILRGGYVARMPSLQHEDGTPNLPEENKAHL